MSTGRIRATALAPAKVNPWLAILGRRDDGYHEVDTALLALDWCDRVTARRIDGGGVELELRGPAVSPDVPADERNLAWRAAERVLAEARRAKEVAPDVGLGLVLEKHLPSRAGLGGGSSDAIAAALAALAVLGIEWSGARLSALAAELGSDTVFFADAASGFARCTGRGERVAPLAVPAGPVGLSIAVLTPIVEAPTGAVYAALGARAGLSGSGLPGVRNPPSFGSSFLDLPLNSLRAQLFNDLEPAALAAVPELSEWRRVLDRVGADHFRLSGSGSSFFGLFDEASVASQCLAEIASLASEQGLGLRATRVAAPSGHGARLVRD